MLIILCISPLAWGVWYIWYISSEPWAYCILNIIYYSCIHDICWPANSIYGDRALKEILYTVLFNRSSEYLQIDACHAWSVIRILVTCAKHSLWFLCTQQSYLVQTSRYLAWTPPRDPQPSPRSADFGYLRLVSLLTSDWMLIGSVWFDPIKYINVVRSTLSIKVIMHTLYSE